MLINLLDLYSLFCFRPMYSSSPSCTILLCFELWVLDVIHIFMYSYRINLITVTYYVRKASKVLSVILSVLA